MCKETRHVCIYREERPEKLDTAEVHQRTS